MLTNKYLLQHVIKLAMRNMLFVFGSVVFIVSAVACAQATVAPIATNAPTATPLPSQTPAPTLQPGEIQHTVTVDGLDRTYLLHIPPGISANIPAPVVIALHGFDDEHFFEVTDLQNMTGFGDISDQNAFILIYPSGDSGVWNVGNDCCGSSSQNNIDEDAFIRAILADVGATANIDSKRVYAAGFSMGGMLAYRFACEMSDTFAAVASVAAGLLLDPCQPSEPVSILQVNGKQDNLVPYNGGLGGFMTGVYTFSPVEDTIASWAKLDGCAATPTTDQQSVALHTVYPDCQAGSSVELYTIDAMGNNWPSQYVLPVSQMIWDFFLAHPKP